ncbi:unnamed protein product [Calicophoron daubneyi]|uniref:Uncharacterized protein n=1 Tax=Calicophoron daubneyi TaxID=300641 RepID=A0AAV2TWG2_CALDB
MAETEIKSRRWLHPDDQLSPESGVSYELRYVGSMPVCVSIKSVDLETRTRIAHASIHRVCEDVGLRLPHPTGHDKNLTSFLGADSDKNWAMTNVYLTITSQSLTVEAFEMNWVMFQHNLSMVSFASGGDADTMDFVCYVAKNNHNERMCYVFECPGGLAQDVIITLGQAFQLGYQNFKRTKALPSKRVSSTQHSITSRPSLPDPLFPSHSALPPVSRLALPAPEDIGKIKFPSQDSSARPTSAAENSTKTSVNTAQVERSVSSNSINDGPPSAAFDNFVDFDEDAWLLENELSNPEGNVRQQKRASTLPPESVQHSNNGQGSTRAANPVHSDPKVSKSCTKEEQFRRLEPVGEPWYVGKMSRAQAESLLRYEGDFLVRASIQQPGQFVLSGLQDSKCRHLLLADPNGQVRTKERVFDSIQHLIDYHVQNGVPIRSADSEIRLIFPVSTLNFCES